MLRDLGLKRKPAVPKQKLPTTHIPKKEEEDSWDDGVVFVPTDPTDFLEEDKAKKLAEQVQKEMNKGNNGSSNSHFELMRACLERI